MNGRASYTGQMANTINLVEPAQNEYLAELEQRAKREARAAAEGTIDPWLKTLSFWDGKQPVAAMHAYAVHPMSYYGNGEVSADFVGMASAGGHEFTFALMGSRDLWGDIRRLLDYAYEGGQRPEPAPHREPASPEALRAFRSRQSCAFRRRNPAHMP